MLCIYSTGEHFARIPGLEECNIFSLVVEESSPEVMEFLQKKIGCGEYINIATPPSSISITAGRGDGGLIGYGLEAWKKSLLYSAMVGDRPGVFGVLGEYSADVNQVLGSEDGSLTTLHQAVV